MGSCCKPEAPDTEEGMVSTVGLEGDPAGRLSVSPATDPRGRSRANPKKAPGQSFVGCLSCGFAAKDQGRTPL